MSRVAWEKRSCLAKPVRVSRAYRVYIEEHEVTSQLVDANHDGMKLAHLSDLHVYSRFKPRRLWRIIDLVNKRQPNVVLLTGDYVCLSQRSLRLLTEALQNLSIPAWATLGNHDHWAGAQAVSAALQMAGIRVLDNVHCTLLYQGTPLHIIGIDDYRTGHAKTAAALSRVASGGTRIVLTHNPLVADEIAGCGIALILAGHTHGGQIRLPGVTTGIARRIGVKYLAGFYELGDTILYVNRGLGASIPLRWAAPREVAFFTLRSSGKI